MARETGKEGYKRKLKLTIARFHTDWLVHDNDPHSTHQGIPDLTVYCGPFWAMLEVKAAADSPLQPNQDYWVEYYNQLSFARFIYPENEAEVLHALHRSFTARQSACRIER